MSNKYFQTAIFTKILPATNTKPTRVKANCLLGSIILSYDYGHSSFKNQLIAVQELLLAHSKQTEWCTIHTAATKEVVS